MSAASITGANNFVTAGQVTCTIPTAGANAVTSVTATMTGVKVGDIVKIAQTSALITHCVQVWATVETADTLTIYGLADGTGFTGASKTYNVEVSHKS